LHTTQSHQYSSSFAFQRVIDEARTLPPNGGAKTPFSCLKKIKLTFSLIKVCYIVYIVPSCYNIQQSTSYCRIVSGLSNGETILAKNVPVQPNVSPQINSPTSKSADLDVISVVHCESKKTRDIFSLITLPNVGRFLKLF